MTSQVDQLVALIGDIRKDTTVDLNGTAAAASASDLSEADRLRVRDAARQLLAHVEKPQEKPYGFSFEYLPVFAALQTCVDLGLWKSWEAAGGGTKTIDDLVRMARPEDAAATVAPNLLRRLFRLLAAFHVVEETAPDTFRPTGFSTAMGYDMHGHAKTQTHVSAQNTVMSHYVAVGHHLPRYLADIGYQEPTAAQSVADAKQKRSNHSAVDPDGLNYFDRLQASPLYYEIFSAYMQAWTTWKTPWSHVYDPASLLDGADLASGKPLLVDIGGNVGQDIEHAIAAIPNAAAVLPADALVLQDLPEAIAIAKDKLQPHQAITKPMVHDFFQPQPVKGARAYLLHAVLHDWPDAEAAKILQQTRDAMTPGYSKLLVMDVVVPRQGASIVQAMGDVNMMSLLSAAERTEAAWEKLLTDAGLKVIKFWKDPKKYENLMEAEIA